MSRIVNGCSAANAALAHHAAAIASPARTT
jgi:hypothetical protein